jgi:hypothetical protein
MTALWKIYHLRGACCCVHCVESVLLSKGVTRVTIVFESVLLSKGVTRVTIVFETTPPFETTMPGI